MSIESLNSPGFIERAATTLEQALARIVAHFRAEVASDKRAVEAEYRAAIAELAIVSERIEQAHKEFDQWFAKMQERRIELRGADGKSGIDGKDGAIGARGEQGPPGERGEVGARGEAGEAGARGEEGAPGERGAEGPQGRDGRDGMPGLPGGQGDRGKDGIDGKDGKDGLDGKSFDNLNFADIHRGPYVSGEAYQRGHCATYGGSTFVCLRDTTAKPESEDWRLIVKHGLPGRNGKDGERGPAGPSGRDGRDLTQMTREGMKYG